MSNLAAHFERYIARKEAAPSTAVHIIAILLFISIVRLGLEILPNMDIDQGFLPVSALLRILFYTGTFFLFFAFASLFFAKEIEKVRSIVLIGMLGSLFPPFITLLFPHSTHGDFDYFSHFSWNFFSSSQPVGEGIGLWLTIAIVGIYFFYKKRTSSYLFAGLAGAYALLQLSGWFLMVPTGILQHALKPLFPDAPYIAAFSVNIVWFVVILACFAFTRSNAMSATLKRFPHTLMRGALVFVGAQLAGGFTAFSAIVAMSYMAGFMFIQAENDFYDKKLDAATSRESAISGDDLLFIRFFMALFVLNFWILNFEESLLLGLFFLLGFFYNHPSFRLKRHFIGSSLIEGGAAFLGILAGIFSIQRGVSASELGIIALLAAIFAVISNIKDYKDFAGDKKMGMQTLYVWLSQQGISPERLHGAIIALMSAVYASSIAMFFFFFHVPISLLAPLLILLVISALPLFLIGRSRASLSSSAAVAVAGIYLCYTAFFILPLLHL